MAKPALPFTNPDLRLDPALGLVVIEFHDDSGKLTNSIPSQRQIDAYRQHGQTRSTPPASGQALAAPGTLGSAAASGSPASGASAPNQATPGTTPFAQALPMATAPKGRNGEAPAG